MHTAFRYALYALVAYGFYRSMTLEADLNRSIMDLKPDEPDEDEG